MKINQLCLTRSKHKILHQVTAEFPQHGVVVLLGANGAGKSSLLGVLAGLLHPDSGELSGVTNMSRYMLPEPAVFYPYLTVREQLCFVAGQMNREAHEVEQALEDWGLTEMAGKPTRQLSLGYRQRLSLAQLEVSDAALLLMDEPMNGMDPEVLSVFQRQVSQWKTHKLIIIATHIMQEMEALTDWVMVLHQGQLIDSRAHQQGHSFQNLYQQAMQNRQAATHTAGDPQ